MENRLRHGSGVVHFAKATIATGLTLAICILAVVTASCDRSGRGLREATLLASTTFAVADESLGSLHRSTKQFAKQNGLKIGDYTDRNFPTSKSQILLDIFVRSRDDSWIINILGGDLRAGPQGQLVEISVAIHCYEDACEGWEVPYQAYLEVLSTSDMASRQPAS